MKGTIYSVEYINSYIKNMFSQDFMLRSVYVRGEVSNVTYHPSNHIYFTMKDKSGTLKCVMFAGKRSGLNFTLKEGQQIICGGYIGIYEKSGGYQLYASDIVLDGQGLLYEKYEKLKNELEEMGMFSSEYKKAIPKYALKIGVVTASTGAAIQDIINISKRRNPMVQLYLFPAIVQGEGAAQSIVNGIRALDRFGVDVIIVGRGGGSIEDLWGFNEEIVARAIFECNTPIVSAVGHETDFTIADLVSDLRAPTPSAAAEMTVFSLDEFNQKILENRTRLTQTAYSKINYNRVRLEKARLLVDKKNPRNDLDNKRMYHMHLDERLRELMQSILNSKKHRYELYIEQLKGLSPLEKLSKGYVYAKKENKPLISIDNLKEDDEVTIYLSDGAAKTKVVEIL